MGCHHPIFSKSSTSASALPEVKNDEKVDDPSPTHAAYTKMLNDHKKGNDACCTRGQIKTSVTARRFGLPCSTFSAFISSKSGL